ILLCTGSLLSGAFLGTNFFSYRLILGEILYSVATCLFLLAINSIFNNGIRIAILIALVFSVIFVLTQEFWHPFTTISLDAFWPAPYLVVLVGNLFRSTMVTGRVLILPALIAFVSLFKVIEEFFVAD